MEWLTKSKGLEAQTHQPLLQATLNSMNMQITL